MIYRNLHLRQKYIFGDTLRKFLWKLNIRIIDSVCVLNSMPKSVYFMLFFAVDKTSSFVTLNPAVNCNRLDFSTRGAYLYSIHISLISFQKNIKDLTKWRPIGLLLHFFFSWLIL